MTDDDSPAAATPRRALEEPDDADQEGDEAGTARDATDGTGTAPGTPPAELGLPVAAVARRLGVAPATLRTWARRYGLGPSAHAAGAHRRYGPGDIARLDTMRRLTRAGAAPAEAAAAALAGAAATPEHPASPRRGGPGGRVLSLPGRAGVVRGLGRAAMALDSASVTATLRAQLEEFGVVHTWNQVLRPVLSAAGARWASTGEGVEVEHLLSDCIIAALREVAERADPPTGRRPVLLASAPDEQHALPLHAVAAGLAERGVASVVLGPALPAASLEAAVRRTGASALFVWSQLPSTADPGTVARLPGTTRPSTAVVVGGPGWVPGEVPDRVRVASDLDDALELVSAAARG